MKADIYNTVHRLFTVYAVSVFCAFIDSHLVFMMQMNSESV